MNDSNHHSGGSHPAGLSTSQPGALPRITNVPSTLPRPTGAPALNKPHQDDLSPISLDGPVMSSAAPAVGSAPRTAQSMGIAHMIADHEKEYKRTANMTGNGAVHIKSFHCHLSDDGLRHLDHRINDWLEAHEKYEVKFVTTNIGLWDGKTKDPELIVNVWY